MNHDNIGRSYTVGPSLPPLCQSCGLSISPTHPHENIYHCYKALMDFVALCQDEIEELRMGSFQKPTREELLQILYQIAEHFEAQGGLYTKYGQAVREVISGKITYGSYTQRADAPGGRKRYYYTQESVYTTDHDPSYAQEPVADDDVRELLPPDVSYETQGVDEDHQNQEGAPYNISPESTPIERMRQDVVEEEGFPNQG